MINQSATLSSLSCGGKNTSIIPVVFLGIAGQQTELTTPPPLIMVEKTLLLYKEPY